MAKRQAKKKVKKKTSRRTKRTRCEEGAEELLPLFITVRESDSVELRVTLCKSAFRVVVFLDGQKLLDEDSSVLPDDLASVLLPRMAAGVHSLHWGYLAVGTPWQTKSEVFVEQAARFRQRKGEDSRQPWNHSFVLLEVKP
jgi:hypothetical protein